MRDVLSTITASQPGHFMSRCSLIQPMVCCDCAPHFSQEMVSSYALTIRAIVSVPTLNLIFGGERICTPVAGVW
jgi:hypothetical protein